MADDWYWSKVDTSNLDTCWEWAGTKTRKGYGLICKRNRFYMKLAHRVIYAWAHGSIPEGMFVCHSCDNPACVNPLHLFVGTAADNNADRDRKGRQSRGPEHGRLSMAGRKNTARGEQSGMAKLTEDDVRAIRASNLPSRAMASEFGVSHRSILNVRQRRTWRHVP